MKTTRKKIVVMLLSLTILVIANGSALAAVSYTLKDLGALSGNNAAQAWDINGSGQVVGRSYNTANPVYTEFISSNGSPSSLNITVSSNSIPGLNDLGQVVGDSYNNHAFLWTNGSFQDLGTLTGGATSSANGVNNAGQVVGISDTATSGVRHAFIWDATNGMQDLGSLGGLSSARRINNSGQVVGYHIGTDAKQHAFIWTSSGGMKGLDVQANGSQANGINDLGQVVGASNGGYGSFFWSAATGAINLKNFPNVTRRIQAFDINSAGQIVGFGSPAPSTGDRALVWDSYDSTPVDLNTIYTDAIANGWILSEATGINDKGQITGWMRRTDGASLHAFVLTPVPLPPAVLLLGSGCAFFPILRRRVDKHP
jgi:probable HAF family extracellular repeat protein